MQMTIRLNWDLPKIKLHSPRRRGLFFISTRRRRLVFYFIRIFPLLTYLIFVKGKNKNNLILDNRLLCEYILHMKNLRDYTPEELDALEMEMSGFISGFGFTWSKDYTDLIVAVKAKMEADECDYLNRPKPVPKTDLEKESARYEALKKESIALGKRLVDTIRPDVQKAIDENDFEKAHDISYTIPDCVGRLFLQKGIMDAEDKFNEKKS